jgi:adenine deaminase
MGTSPADLVVRGGRLANVYTGEMLRADVAVCGEWIAAVGDCQAAIGPDTWLLDASGRVVTPGLIDAHIHTYEAHLAVANIAPPLLAHGVTTIATDFYGETVVAGSEAIRLGLEAARSSPLNVLWTLPLPALYQDRPFVHTCSVDADELAEMLEWDECIGVNECFSSFVNAGDVDVLRFMRRARQLRKALCGHGSEVSGSELMAWAAAGGCLDDHECVTADEVVEKARLGIRIVLREGSGASDVRRCLAAITETGVDPRRFCFCADLLSPVDLLREGDIDRCVRYAIEAGVDFVEAVRMGSLNAAETLHVDAWLGGIAPGKRADLCVLRGAPAAFRIDDVVAGGRIVVQEGEYVGTAPAIDYPARARTTVRLPELTTDRFRIGTRADEFARVRAIRVRDGSIVTEESIVELPVREGAIQANPQHGVLKVASFERHGQTGRVGVGFVEGFGLSAGALASTYNPHCQHLLVLGAADDDMLLAAQTIEEMQGGFAVVRDGAVLARVPLPLYGLLSERPAKELVEQIEAAIAAARQLGCTLSAPFHTLAFLGLPVVIGKLKICSAGLVDVWQGRTVPVEVEAGQVAEVA